MIHTTFHEPNVVVVRPGVDRLTSVNAKAFKDELSALFETGMTQIIIDFTKVTFLDSSGLGALVGILKKLGFRGELTICGLSTDVAHMFKISRMDKVFSIQPDVPAALQMIGESP